MSDTKQEADLSADAEFLSDLITAIKAAKSRGNSNEAISLKIKNFMNGFSPIE